MTLISHGSSNNNDIIIVVVIIIDRPNPTPKISNRFPVSFWPRFISVRVWFTVPARYGSCRFGFCGSVRFAGTLKYTYIYTHVYCLREDTGIQRKDAGCDSMMVQ